jgi:hypothetical protein
MTSINRCNSCLNCNDKKSVFLVVPLSLSCLVKICFLGHSSVIVLGSDSDSIFRVKVLVSLSTCTNFLFVI